MNFKLPQSSSFMTLLTPSRFRQHVVSPTIGIRGRMHLDDRVRKPWFYILVAAFLFLIDDYLILSGLSKGSLIFGKISSDPVIYSSYG